ncbi:MAG: hypothetical protein AMXMBFR12_01600 [Candidatus Babeliales bacterium]
MSESDKSKAFLRQLERTRSSELQKDDLAKDAGMIQAVTKAAGKGISPRDSKGSASSPHLKGRGRTSSLSQVQTAEELLAVAIAAGSAT